MSKLEQIKKKLSWLETKRDKQQEGVVKLEYAYRNLDEKCYRLFHKSIRSRSINLQFKLQDAERSRSEVQQKLASATQRLDELNSQIVILRNELQKSTQEIADAPRCAGKIKMFNKEKGFGFIETDDINEDVFFHISEMTDNCDNLNPGTTVEFTLGKNKKGYVARKITF